MHPLIETNRSAIEALCREFGVQKLEVFGSIMTDSFTADPDVDFLVTYPDGYDFRPWGSRLFDFEERLAIQLKREVDVVMLSALKNTYVKREADKTRTEIFDASNISKVA